MRTIATLSCNNVSQTSLTKYTSWESTYKLWHLLTSQQWTILLALSTIPQWFTKSMPTMPPSNNNGIYYPQAYCLVIQLSQWSTGNCNRHPFPIYQQAIYWCFYFCSHLFQLFSPSICRKACTPPTSKTWLNCKPFWLEKYHIWQTVTCTAGQLGYHSANNVESHPPKVDVKTNLTNAAASYYKLLPLIISPLHN